MRSPSRTALTYKKEMNSLMKRHKAVTHGEFGLTAVK